MPRGVDVQPWLRPSELLIVERRGKIKIKNTQMSRASPTLEVRASDERSRHGASLKPSQRCLWAEGIPGEACVEEIHAAGSTAAPRQSTQDPSLNVLFSSGWTYQGRAQRAWTGGFKRPEPDKLVHAQFSGDEISAASGSVGGLRMCKILFAVMIILIRNIFINKAQFWSRTLKIPCLLQKKTFFILMLPMVQFFVG